jgi:hypothetical protein
MLNLLTAKASKRRKKTAKAIKRRKKIAKEKF